MEEDFEDLVRCAKTLKIQGLYEINLPPSENQNEETENSLSQEETTAAPAAETEQELNDEDHMDDLDVEDTEFLGGIRADLSEPFLPTNQPEINYPIVLVHPITPTQVAAIEPIREISNSGESPLMNTSAESDPEILNPADVAPMKRRLRLRTISQNCRISEETETEYTSRNSEEETENSSRKKKKIDKMPFGSPPEHFVLLPWSRKRSYDKNTMWSALMSVENNMSISNAARTFGISNTSIRDYMNIYGIKSQKTKQRQCQEMNNILNK
ncbi:hypothetical protein DMENIID0001_169530 [Sergentomyia squamirostris]